MAYIGLQSATESTIKVKIYGLDSTYARADRVCTWYLNGRKYGTQSLGAKITQSNNYTFSGLNAGTSYDILASITAEGWTITVELEDTFETEKAVSVKEWSWSASNGAASASQTSAAFSAIRNKGKLSNFSYLVWNDLVDKVKEVQEAKGKSWMTNYATYNATRMSASDKRLTATRFNSLRYNIGFYYSTGISEVRKGNIVYGYYFTTLANCLNKWIAE